MLMAAWRSPGCVAAWIDDDFWLRGPKTSARSLAKPLSRPIMLQLIGRESEDGFWTQKRLLQEHQKAAVIRAKRVCQGFKARKLSGYINDRDGK